MVYVDVIVPLPFNRAFTYTLPAKWQGKAAVGMRVLVPFRSRRLIGLAVEIHTRKPDFQCRDIESVVDQKPSFGALSLSLMGWISRYYMATIGEVYNAALPNGMKQPGSYRTKTETCVRLGRQYQDEAALHRALDSLKRAQQQKHVFETYLTISRWETIQGTKTVETVAEITKEELLNESQSTAAAVKALTDKGLLEVYDKPVSRLNTEPGAADFSLTNPLNEVQSEAFKSILQQFESHETVLLHGVTSSGKTEIYIHLIQKAIKEGKQVLYLLPEIALTIQIRDRLQRVFGSRLGIYHSKYSDEERVEIWQKQLSDEPYDVILGARSAAFLPFKRLGLVIVDEEHETSFKQQDPAPRYHGRSVALVLAHLARAHALLGTATPSSESFYNAKTGKYGYVFLNTRYNDVSLPEVNIVDVKDLKKRKMMTGVFSPLLIARVREALKRGEQAILFRNRRGFAPSVVCKQCGWTPHCTDCDVSLTYHKVTDNLTCHYCGAVYDVPTECPNCHSHDIMSLGYGTERVEDSIHTLLPEAKISRMDLDTTRTRGAYERIIRDFATGKTNLLVGTQMVTKGLDFSKVSTVGILDADAMLNIPDFRAYEYAFQMLSQVSGRAGRRGKGTVILQTKSPEESVIREIAYCDYRSFYASLLEERKAFCYPPFSRLIIVYLRHKDAQVADHAAQEMAMLMRKCFPTGVLGPDSPFVARIKTLHIRKIVLKLSLSAQPGKAKEQLWEIKNAVLQKPPYRMVDIYFDVDAM